MLGHAYLIRTIYGLQPSFPQRFFEDCLIWMKSVRSVRPERERERKTNVFTPPIKLCNDEQRYQRMFFLNKY